MRKAALALLVSASLAIAPGALARTTVIEDPNDARGVLDVRRVAKLGARRPVWRIDTARRWRAVDVRDRGYAVVYLDTFGAPRHDYIALVRSTGPRLVARLVRDRRRERDNLVGYVAVWRRNRRSLSVRVPLRRMIVPDAREVYRWRVQTLVTGPRCRRVCFDRAPNAGPVEEPVPSPPEEDR